MLFKNALIFNGLDFVPGGFRVEEGRFTQVFSGTVEEAGEDLQGAYVIPGLVDVHNHGNSGADFSDGNLEGLRTMRVLGHNMAYFLHCLAAGRAAGVPLPPEEPPARTNFIR